MSRAKAVIFDMDGLMLDTQRMATVAWRQAVSTFGFQLTDKIILKLLGRNNEDSNEILKNEFGSEFPFEDCRILARKTYADDMTKNGIPVKAGLLPLLEYLEKKSIKVAVATSTAREFAVQRLEQTNLIGHFPVIVTGDEVTRGKPFPDIFLNTSELLQIPAKNCVVLEDSFSGIQAAFSAKMIPIMVPDLFEPTHEIESLAYAVVPSLNEAKKEIEKLMAEKGHHPLSRL